MRKLIFGLILLIPILVSCAEDEDKVIQTDLPTEALELFSISKDWNESLYFAMISWEQYQELDTVGLPSCPDIILNENTREVTLNFLSSTACIQTGNYGRSGKLIIQYDTTTVGSNQKWTMEYDNYFFANNSIRGKRTFSSEDSLQISEDFTGLIVKTKDDLSTELSGKFLHTKTYGREIVSTDSLITDSLTNYSLIKFNSTGRIRGKNASGRDFDITIDTPSSHTIACYQQNEILPNAGKENWYVSRAGNSGVTYTVTYEPLIEDCKVAVNAILPDGKKLLLNPSN